MNTSTQDLTRFEQLVDTMKAIADHTKSDNRPASDWMYYELMHKYYSKILTAKEEGKWIVCNNNLAPTELFHAMDIVPMEIEGSTAIMTVLLQNQDEVFSVAKNLGYATEICSLTRAVLAVYCSGWVPRPDMVVWSNEPCDHNVKTGDPIMKAFDIPGFFIDVSYHYGEREVEYLAAQLKDAVAFLEKVTGKRMDEERFKETLRLEQQMISLEQEIYRLCNTSPCPLKNRKYLQIVIIRRNLAGTQVGVDYMTQALSEVKELVAQGKGAFPEENYRVMNLFVPPQFLWRIMDKIGYEHGVSIVADPLNFSWEDIDWDFSKPFTTLARRVKMHPNGFCLSGPLNQGLVQKAVNDARERNVHGALYWADVRCREGCAAIRTVKDALREELGIPTYVLDMDYLDPTSISEEEINDRMECFIELMEDMK